MPFEIQWKWSIFILQMFLFDMKIHSNQSIMIEKLLYSVILFIWSKYVYWLNGCICWKYSLFCWNLSQILNYIEKLIQIALFSVFSSTIKFLDFYTEVAAYRCSKNIHFLTPQLYFQCSYGPTENVKTVWYHKHNNKNMLT